MLSKWEVLCLQVGPLCPMVPVLHHVSLTSSSLAALAEDGNTKQLAPQKGCTVTRGSCPESLTTSGLRCALTQVLVWHCLPLLLGNFESSPISSGCCFCADFVSPFPQSLAPAGVAVHSTLLATTAKRAAELGCWAGGVLLWICHKANVFVRDLDLLAPNVHDAKRLEIVAEGLPLYGGAQLAVDTSVVSAHHCDGTATPGAAHVDGAALVVAQRRKERAHPELVGPRSRAKLVAMFLRLLAVACARSESALMRRRAEQAWRMRWGGMLACAAARAFAASLLEQRSNVGGDGIHPLLSDVLSEFRHAGLG